MSTKHHTTYTCLEAGVVKVLVGKTQTGVTLITGWCHWEWQCRDLGTEYGSCPRCRQWHCIKQGSPMGVPGSQSRQESSLGGDGLWASLRRTKIPQPALLQACRERLEKAASSNNELQLWSGPNQNPTNTGEDSHRSRHKPGWWWGRWWPSAKHLSPWAISVSLLLQRGSFHPAFSQVLNFLKMFGFVGFGVFF